LTSKDLTINFLNLRINKVKLNPFHLAIPVRNLEESRIFYRDILGCDEGRSSESWVDFNFFGHQLVIHLKPEYFNLLSSNHSNLVDNHNVPIPHFGIVLDWYFFDEFSKKLQDLRIKFEINPYLRFEGQPGEQKTMFFLDPSGNALEFKSFKNLDSLFQK